MTLLEIFLIGIGLSMDAFAVAICKGLAMPDKVHKRSALLIALYFGPNDDTDPAFGQALRQAARAGVEIAAYSCRVTPGSIEMDRPVPVLL